MADNSESKKYEPAAWVVQELRTAPADQDRRPEALGHMLSLQQWIREVTNVPAIQEYRRELNQAKTEQQIDAAVERVNRSWLTNLRKGLEAELVQVGADPKRVSLITQKQKYLDMLIDTKSEREKLFQTWKETLKRNPTVLELQRVLDESESIGIQDTTPLLNRLEAVQKDISHIPELQLTDLPQRYVTEIQSQYLSKIDSTKKKLLDTWNEWVDGGSNPNGLKAVVETNIARIENLLSSGVGVNQSDVDKEKMRLQKIVNLIKVAGNSPAGGIYSQDQETLWAGKEYVVNSVATIRKLEQAWDNQLQENREKEKKKITLKSLRKKLDSIERLEFFLKDKQEILPGESVESIRNEIEANADPAQKELILEEYLTRINLHDNWLNFFISDFYIDKLQDGKADITPANLETLFHGLKGVEDLVPIALSLFEMALQGKYPKVKNARAATWEDTGGVVEASIAKLLGNHENSILAAKMAGRLVHMSGMISHYETLFKQEVKNEMRDTMNMEGQRFAYGSVKRLLGAGLREHGFSGNVGKFFNVENDPNRPAVNPVITLKPVKGEPPWDLISDLWNFAPLSNEEGNKLYKDGKLQTLTVAAGRYGDGNGTDRPDFEKIARLRDEDGQEVITSEIISALNDLDWNGIVRYQKMHFTNLYLAPDGDEVNSIQPASTESAEAPQVSVLKKYVLQLKARKSFRDLVIKTNWTVADLDRYALQAKKTVFDYLPNSAVGIRDHDISDDGEKKKQEAELRRIFTTLLWPIIVEHSPGTKGVQSEKAWNPTDLLLIIYRAETSGMISHEQMKFLEEAGGLAKDLLVSRAEREKIFEKALRTAGLPGK